MLDAKNVIPFPDSADELLPSSPSRHQPDISSLGKIFGVVGQMIINGDEFLCVVTDISLAGKVPPTINSNEEEDPSLYLITGVEFYPRGFGQMESMQTDANKQTTKELIAKLKKYLKGGFYISYKYDVTASRQRRLHLVNKAIEKGLSLPVASDPDYFWNNKSLQFFREHNVDSKWFTPIIQGHVGYVEDKVGDLSISITLISRRQHMRTGTRLNVRGIDDDGYAGNFVETEQIVRVGDKVYSFVQTRGSVPIFWEQSGKGTGALYEDVTLTRSTEMTRGPFKSHFKRLVEDYQRVLIIDLLKDKKGREERLTKEYFKLFFDSEFKKNDQLFFQHFDFHRFCQNDRFEGVKILITQVADKLQQFG
jgi:hypothetical protein